LFVLFSIVLLLGISRLSRLRISLLGERRGGLSARDSVQALAFGDEGAPPSPKAKATPRHSQAKTTQLFKRRFLKLKKV